jgi:hypothetical protein
MSKWCTSWTLRSPDLTFLKFFQWAFVNDKVYSATVLTLGGLKEGTE